MGHTYITLGTFHFTFWGLHRYHILRLFCPEKDLITHSVLPVCPRIHTENCSAQLPNSGAVEGKQLQPQPDHKLPGQPLQSRPGLGASFGHLLEGSQPSLHLPVNPSGLSHTPTELVSATHGQVCPSLLLFYITLLTS